MITYDQAMTADRFHEDGCTRTVGPRGGVTVRVYGWRRNGATKVWKTRPGEFMVPIKWGLKKCAYLEPHNANLFHVESECPLKGEEA